MHAVMDTFDQSNAMAGLMDDPPRAWGRGAGGRPAVASEKDPAGTTSTPSGVALTTITTETTAMGVMDVDDRSSLSSRGGEREMDGFGDGAASGSDTDGDDSDGGGGGGGTLLGTSTMTMTTTHGQLAPSLLRNANPLAYSTAWDYQGWGASVARVIAEAAGTGAGTGTYTTCRP